MSDGADWWIEGDEVKATEDVIESNQKWTLFIMHQDWPSGRGFLPRLRRIASGTKATPEAEFRVGQGFRGTNEVTYNEALEEGRRLLADMSK